MAPFMYLSRDKIVEVSHFGPAGNEHKTSPTPEKEATLLGEEPELPDTPKATSLPECLEIPEPTEPSEQIDTQPAEPTK